MEERLRHQLLDQTHAGNNEDSFALGGLGEPRFQDGVSSSPEDLQSAQLAGSPSNVPPPPPIVHSPSSENHNSNILAGLALDSPLAMVDGSAELALDDAEAAAVDVTRLPEPLLQALVDIFYSSYYPIFPIIQRQSFQQKYDNWLSTSNADDDDGFTFLLYALLAAAASAIPTDHVVFDNPGVQAYKRARLGNMLYSHALSKSSGAVWQRRGMQAINAVIAQGFLCLYLIEAGNVSSAWVMTGQAIRLYQALDIDDSADAAPDLGEIWCPRGNVWWCLYILDCSLSTALSRPLAVDDPEGDLGSCDEEDRSVLGLDEKTDPWFSVIADLHITISHIYRSIRRIRKSPSQSGQMWDKLRSYMKKYDTELEDCYTKKVQPMIKKSSRQAHPLALQTIAASSYHIGLVLLYRTCIERFNSTEPEAFLRCAEAASNCIQTTPQVIATVPASHFVIQQSRAVYASTKVLLHCMRLARNVSFNSKAWADVKAGFEMLRMIKIQWPQIKKYQQLIEEDMQQTQVDFDRHELFHGIFDRYGHVGGGHAGVRGQEGSSSCHREGRARSPPRSSPSSRPSRRGQDSQFSEEQPKRRKLSQAFSHPTSVSAASLGTLPVRSQPNNHETGDHSFNAGDFAIPDLPPLSSSQDSSGENFFGNAMSMEFIDQTVS